MGGAAEFPPDRASSPLKRRASSMDAQAEDGASEDVDMVTVTSPNPNPEQVEEQTRKVADSEETDEATNTTAAQITQPDSIEAHIRAIRTFCEEFESRPLKKDEDAYVVSRKWVESVIGADPKKNSMPDPALIQPVDNSDIIWEVLDDPCVGQTPDILLKKFVRLKPGIGPEHYTLFPSAAWALLEQWPGLTPGQIPIRRVARQTSDSDFDANVQIEMHPPIFTIHRLWSANSPLPISQIVKTRQPPPQRLPRSTATYFKTFLKQCKNLTDIDLEQKVRLWRVPRKLPAAGPATSNSLAPTPPATPPASDPNNPQDAWPHMLLDVATFLELEDGVDREKIDFRDVSMDKNYNGHLNIGKLALTTDQAIVLDEHVEGTTYVSTYSPSKASANLSTARSSSASLAVGRAARSGRTSPAPSGPATRGRTQKSGRQIGCTGLGNLGNTCYMNSALQCVRSVEELTKYFLSGEWEEEVNRENVLAHNGDVAQAYAMLLKEIYREPPPVSVTPRHFKSTLGRYAPAFSGYGQQDSQEFVGFLLDGLQEDLSRVKKKPYIEKPDSTDDMINNPEAIREMADKVWDITKRRDDSVIADLFTGLYKSTLVCPDPGCGKISITFDPFNSLSLPLPLENKWSHVIKFFPLNDKPIDIRVELDKSSSFKKLKEFISGRTGVPVERMHGAEEWKHKFYKNYSNGASASEEIGNNDNAWIYELEAAPTNWNSAESRKLEIAGSKGRRSLIEEAEEPGSEVSEALLVPVMHRVVTKNQYGSQRRQFALAPHFIVVNPEEARNEDIIRRKILQKVATLSKHDIFARREESDSSDTSDFATASSDLSGNVVAQSVQSEDDMVDVTMKDVADEFKASPQSSAKQSSAKYPFNKAAPSWVDPKEHLPAELQNVFELSYFQEHGSLLANGMHGLSEDKEYPKLSSRAPETSNSDDADDNATNDTASVEDESSDEVSQRSSDLAPTRMADETDDEDGAPPVKVRRLLAPRDGSKNSGTRMVIKRAPMHTSREGNANGSKSLTEDQVQQIPHRPKPSKVNTKPLNGQKKMKAGKKYGKKGAKRLQRQAAAAQRKQQAQQELEAHSPAETEDSGVDGGPLIRLREGIVVDWVDNAYTAFIGEPNSNLVIDSSDTLPDPELDRTQQLRAKRRKHGITLENCLDEFEREEVLSENDTWYCPRCKQHQRASKKFDLWKTPDILVVHLKRFSSSGWRRDKLEVLVDFPIEGLDLTERVLHKEDGKTEMYDLIGVDCHWGGLGGGHYTAHAKNFVDNQWYSYNDASVSKVTPDRIVDSSAYLLFYRRRSDQPLGGPRFKEIIDAMDPGSDEDADEAGEGRRLDEGSSPTGSSSAYQEQEPEATHPRRTGAHGGRVNGSGPNASKGNGALFSNSTFIDNDQNLRRSIEVDDEGIDMAENPVHHSAFQSSWNFSTLTTQNMSGGDVTPGSPVASDPASDEAQHDSSGDEAFGAMGDCLDHDTDMDTLPGLGHIELPVAQPGPPAYDAKLPLTVDNVDRMWKATQIGHDIHEIPAGGEDQNSEEATEIRLEDDDNKSRLD